MTSILHRVASQKQATTRFPNCSAPSESISSLLRPTPTAPLGLPSSLASPGVIGPGPRTSRPTPLRAATPEAATSGTFQAEMADTDLELAAKRVLQLEAEAVAMHDLAQRLNKEGRFDEAQAAYGSMHALEDEASQLAARVGCVACVLGDNPGEGQEQPSLCNMDLAVLLPYQRLHPALPWPRPQPRASAPHEQQQQQQEPPQPPQPHVEAADDGPLLSARALGAVVGSALADAAAMGVHWVYDLDVLEEMERQRRQQVAASSSASPASPSPPLEHPAAFGLEFTDPPRSPFYSYPSGRNSPYGEQTLVLLRSLAEGAAAAAGSGGSGSGGATLAAAAPGLHCEAYAELFSATFGSESGFDGYRDVSTKGFLRNHDRGIPPPLSGANDAQANCVARLAPLLAAFGASDAAAAVRPSGDANGVAGAEADGGAGATGAEWSDPLLGCVEWATRVTQNTDAAVGWASAGAVVLERILLGSTAEAAVRHVVQDLQSPRGRLAPHVRELAPEIAARLVAALQLRDTPVPAAVAALGRNCHMPNALQTPLQVVMHVEWLLEGEARRKWAGEGGGGGGGAGGGDPRVGALLPEEAYVWGVRLAVREGGCCASRAAYVGACLGAMVAARGGGTGLPEEWLRRYPAAAQVRVWTETVLEARRKASAA